MVVVDAGRDVAGDALDLGKVGLAGFAGRRADRDEADRAWGYGRPDVGCEPALASAMISGSPGSKMGIPPRLSRSIRAASLSTQMTSWPIFARHVPDVSPTYPQPMMAIFIAEL
jgi:hypothetical protein